MQTVRTINKRFWRQAAVAAGVAVVPFTVGTAVLVTPDAARADVQTYADSKRVYKVGLLMIDSTADANLDGIIDATEAQRGPENPDPFVFYVADQRTDIKPNGWVLENPLAPATVTTDVLQRWQARDLAHPYKIGQTVTKDMAAYWEVSLTKATEAELLQYDLLFITNHRRTRFSPADREKLRKVVDAGGVVWMDDCGGMTIDPNGRFFLEEVQFNSGTGSAANAGPRIVQPAHPLLNSPYTLSYDDILRLGDKAYRNYYLVTMPPGVATTTNAAPNRETLSTIIGNTAATDSNGNALPYVTAGIYGSGAVILTSADVGCGVNDYVGGVNIGVGGNSGAYSGNNLIAANIEDLKITYNAIAWGGANNTVRRNNRRTAASFSATSAPLNPSFDFRNTLANSVSSNSSAIISQGIMYVAGVDQGGNYTLRAYDTVPGRDYDNDGNYDDGIQDLIRGTAYDEIWRWQGGAASGLQPSSPVLATLNDANGRPLDVIMITLGDGTVVVFNARPVDGATGRLSPAAQLIGTNPPSASGGGNYTGVANAVAPSPVYFGNKIYAVEPARGLVRCIDASTLATTWTSTVTSTATSNPSNAGYIVTATPTLGLNRLVVNKTRDTNRPSQENTIAANTNETTNDVMLYVPTVDTSSGSSNSKVLAYWLGARNEGAKDIRSESGNTYVRFRPSSGQQVFISKGGNGFITPTVQVFADVDLPDGRHFSREENFAAGRPVFPMDAFFTANGYTGGAWTATWEDSTVNGGYYSGRVSITRNGAPLDTNVERVLAVASYDVVYNPADSSAAPTDVATTPGHRNSGPMTIPNSRGLDTVAFAPNDLLIYTANQLVTNTTSDYFGVVNAMQEREFSLNASRLRWRYLLHQGATQTVNNITVTDLPALRNRAIFNTSDPNAPLGLTRLISDPTFNNGAFYEPLVNVNTIGAPITTNDGVTYVLARASSQLNPDPGNTVGTVTVLMAFQTVPQITLELGEPIQNNTTVTLTQFDPLTGTTVSTNGDPNDRTRVDVDYRTGRITVADFGAMNNGNNMLSASSAFVVTYTKSAGNTGGATAAPVSKVIYPFGTLPSVSTADDLGTVLQAATGTSSGGYSPLLWYYVLPGNPQSAPTLIGNQLFFNTVINNKSWVIALDADPASNDPTVRVRSGEQVYGVTDQIAYGTAAPRDVARNHVRWLGALNGDVSPIGFGSPTGGEGVLAVNTPAGTNSFSEGLTLLADQKRVMEVNADGAPVWSADGTAEIQTSGGAPPVYNGSGGLETPANTRGRQTMNAKSFSSPQTVRRLGPSDYLVADTGNNRIVRFDRSGKVQWNLERINDPLGVLAPGDPRALNTPTDVLTRTLSSFDTAGNRIGYEVHYIIADSGNHRVIDVVDYYDLNGRVRSFDINGQGGTNDADATTHVVVWTSKTKSADNNQFEYHNLQLSAEFDQAAGAYGKPVLVASVSNSNVAAANNTATSSTAGGSVVRLDYNPRNTAFIMTQANGASAGIKYYWGAGFNGTSPDTATAIAEPAANGRVQLAINELRFVTGTPFTKRLRNPSYFEQIPMAFGNVTVSVYLVADANGIYLCTINTGVIAGESVFDVIWAFGQDQYNVMNSGRMFNPVGTPAALPAFSPSSVKRLANGHFLITNSAVGASKIFESGQFLGEVFEISPAAFDVSAGPTGVTVNSTTLGGTYANFSAPYLKAGNAPVGTAGRVLNKQQMGRDRNGATLTEQPRSADRL